MSESTRNDDRLVDRFEQAWRDGQRPGIDAYLGGSTSGELLIELVAADLKWRLKAGEPARVEPYLERYPDLGGAAEVMLLVRVEYAQRRALEPGLDVGEYYRRFPQLDKQLRQQFDQPPAQLGRYRVTGRLGAGGFGVVYRGRDEELRRDVAIKVPHRHRLATARDADLYLAEARAVASLDCPHIVPVYDVGRTDDGLCFVVTKYLENGDLARKLKEGILPFAESARFAAVVAEALHHAHTRGLVHRDVKPNNILIDHAGEPVLTDFGLALRDEDFGKDPGVCGTPAYMSPEQANGEGHRVDGRSDIFSLGVVLYEMLTGRRPFRDDLPDILQQIVRDEPRPLRQVDDAIPKELERICLKALAKRATDRYTTARDLADDLRAFFTRTSAATTVDVRPSAPSPSLSPASTVTPRSTPAVKIVPKGLRAFDAYDADFFLALLPGPRDRDGLPESIRFWKSRLEERDGDAAFPIGLIYGPSGSGKTSLVKAGLLPRLSSAVAVVYVEATASDTETRLLAGVRRRCPGLGADLGLKETLASLRRGQGTTPGTKVVIVIDQFEQWLHAAKDLESAELVQALRQCDGRQVQCVILVRDDFWLAVSRFLKALEVPLVEGQNCALVDLFDLDHARKVLAAFGQAFGRLPERSRDYTKDESEFLQRVVTGLAEDGKVVCIRLALFAEMVKGKPWTAATLKEVGGTAGIGVAFLDETFTASAAPPQHRLHQKAAQAVLKALLPEAGAAIKGHMRSSDELLAASGYADRPAEFDDLIRILDREIRLVTPTDPAGLEGDRRDRTGQWYQLTHDYLVPSLREWLTRKQKESRRGRAELLLADRAAIWSAREETRQLPTLFQWLRIVRYTSRRHRTPVERRMMARATSNHAIKSAAIGLFLAFVVWMIDDGRKDLKANALYNRLLVANTTDVPRIVRELEPYRSGANPLLRAARTTTFPEHDDRIQLNVSLALLPVDAGEADYLLERMLDADPHDVAVIRSALQPHHAALLDRLWQVAAEPPADNPGRRLHAAAALAAYDPNSPRWARVQERVADDFVAVPTVYVQLWMKLLRPVRHQLEPRLMAVFRDRTHRESERYLATDILADYVADRPHLQIDLLLDADERQFATFFPKVKEHAAGNVKELLAELDRAPPEGVMQSDRDRLALRQANAAVCLLKLQQHAERVWRLLAPRPDPRGRTCLIHRLGSLKVDAGVLRKRLAEEKDNGIRCALVLALGEVAERDWQPAERDAVVALARQLYQKDDDAGLHAAAEWLLRKWGHGAWLEATRTGWAKDDPARTRRLEAIRVTLTAAKPEDPARWYVNGEGQTMVVIPGPMRFTMGSPEAEKEEGRAVREVQHVRRINRSFAVAATAVTVGEYRRFDPTLKQTLRYAPTDDCPIDGVSWFVAAKYCNWLSRREGLELCFVEDDRGVVVRLRENYLSLSGYRLPTEAEFEYACRARTTTARYFGQTSLFLNEYGWYVHNANDRSWPVGTKKPNDFGLFDMLGNVRCWCMERHQDYPQGRDVVDDVEDALDCAVNDQRVLRGGWFGGYPNYLRCADRDFYAAHTKYGDIGFRLARTIAVSK